MIFVVLFFVGLSLVIYGQWTLLTAIHHERSLRLATLLGFGGLSLAVFAALMGNLP